MGIPQIIMICLYMLVIGENLAKDGEPRDSNYSFFGSLLGTAIVTGLLWWGGFFG